MMNLLGLSLLLTSMAAAGVFSPTPAADTTPPSSTIVKEGHRVVVVEYDQDGHHNTKISISPPQNQHESPDGGALLSNAKDKIKEAASVLPNLGQGISHSQEDPAFLHASKDVICDAYGKCKHKIASAIGKAKDKAHDDIAAKREAVHEVKEAVHDAKEAVQDKAQDVKDYTMESVEKAKETGQAVKNHVVRNASYARDKLLMGVKGAVERAAGHVGVMMDSLMGVADLMGFAIAYGMCVWVTFMSSYVLSRAMPRQQFAVVQSKIYPVYFRAMAYSIGLALFGHLLRNRKRLFSSSSGNAADMLQACNLVASLLTVVINSVYLEPRATKLMFERMKVEKEEGRGRDDLAAPERSRTTEQETTADPKESPGTNTAAAASASASPTRGVGVEHDAVRSKIVKLNEKLKKLNSYSSILNILNLMSLTWHLVYLAQHGHGHGHHHAC